MPRDNSQCKIDQLRSMMQDECGLDFFPVDEDNHYIDILKVFDMSYNAEKLLALNPREAADDADQAAKVMDQFQDFYRGTIY